MPDFAPNYTARLRVAYTAVGKNHHMTWRMPADTIAGDLSDYADKVIAFLAAIGPKLYNDTIITGWSWQAADSDIFLPYGGPAWSAGAVSVSGRPSSQEAMALSFVGRSVLGQRAAFFLYGVGVNPVTDVDSFDFRIHASEDANVSTALAVLNDAVPQLVANDNASVIWYEYANMKYNDYWVRKSR